MASPGHHLRRYRWRCHACGSARVDPLAARIPLLLSQGLPKGTGRGKMEHSISGYPQHGLLRCDALHLLTNHGRHTTSAVAGGAVLSKGSGLDIAMGSPRSTLIHYMNTDEFAVRFRLERIDVSVRVVALH